MAKAALAMYQEQEQSSSRSRNSFCCLCLFVPMKAVEMWLHQQCHVPLSFSPPLPLKNWIGLFYFASRANRRQLNYLEKSMKPKDDSGIKTRASECSLSDCWLERMSEVRAWRGEFLGGCTKTLLQD